MANIWQLLSGVDPNKKYITPQAEQTLAPTQSAAQWTPWSPEATSQINVARQQKATTLGVPTDGGAPTGDVLGDQPPAPPPPGDDEGLFDKLQSQIQEQARIDLEDALTQYDKYEEETKLQQTSLVGQKERSIAEMEAGLGKSEKAHITAKEEATEATTGAKGKLLSAAQSIQRKNRNVLRALGILSSSAAGEMLSRPMTEYGKQSGELTQGLVKRLGKIEDWWMERQGDFDRAKNSLIAQFDELMGKIDIDLRFNKREKISTVKAAQKALEIRTSEIQQASLVYQQQAQQYSNDILMQIVQIKLYQNPQADMSGILSSLIQPGQPKSQPQQVGTLLSDEEKRKYGLLSGYNV